MGRHIDLAGQAGLISNLGISPARVSRERCIASPVFTGDCVNACSIIYHLDQFARLTEAEIRIVEGG